MPRAADAVAVRDLVAAKIKNAGHTFRKQVAARAKLDQDRTSMNRYTETWGDGTQYVCELIQRSSDGQYGVIEYEGLVRNIPRIGRAKRTAEALDDDEEEDEAIVAVDRPEVAHLWDDQVRGRTTARIIKKKRTSAVASTRKPTAPPSRMSGPNVSAPTRRSTRNTATVGRTRQHSTIPEETSAHDVRRGMRNQPVVKDEEQDISDLMNQFEINSNAGTESTQVFSRETSRATSVGTPVASSSSQTYVN